MLVLKSKSQQIDQVLFSPDGSRLAARGTRELVWWESLNVIKPELIAVEPGHSVAFDPWGSSLLYVDRSEGLKIRSLRTGSVEFVEPAVPGTQLTASQRKPVLVATSLYRIVRFDMKESGAVERIWSEPAKDLPSAAWFSSDGQSVCYFDSGQFIMRHEATGEIIRSESSQVGGWGRPAATPDSRLLAVFYYHFIVIHDLQGGLRPVAKLENPGRKHITDLAFHPSGRFLAATSNDQTVKLYDTQTWELAKTFTWNIGRMRSIAFSPDGLLAAAGSDTGKVVVWDVDL